jgi:hypothetical protein
MPNSTISYLWRDKGAARASGPAFRCTATPTSRTRRWIFWPTSATSIR